MDHKALSVQLATLTLAALAAIFALLAMLNARAAVETATEANHRVESIQQTLMGELVGLTQRLEDAEVIAPIGE